MAPDLLSAYVVNIYKGTHKRPENTSDSSRNSLKPEVKPLKVFYDVLEISADASQSDIKQAYREMSKVWHPDRFGHDNKLQAKAEEKMKVINEAYNSLCNS